MKNTLEESIANEQIQKYHFILLRNLYEKTASFLGFPRWKELLPDNKETYYSRILQFTSHFLLSMQNSESFLLSIEALLMRTEKIYRNIDN